MPHNWRRQLRFSSKSLLVLVLGIAIGYSLNLETFRLLTGPWWHSAAPGPYLIEPPDVLEVRITNDVNGRPESLYYKCLVGPDGRINLDKFGTVYVAGMSLDEAREATSKALATNITTPEVSIDVHAFNSKVYYVITPAAGGGDSVMQCPFTGNETVLDAIAHVGGISTPTRPEVSVARSDGTLQVDWKKIANGGSTATNYQLMPGDRVIVVNTAGQTP